MVQLNQKQKNIEDVRDLLNLKDNWKSQSRVNWATLIQNRYLVLGQELYFIDYPDKTCTITQDPNNSQKIMLLDNFDPALGPISPSFFVKYTSSMLSLALPNDHPEKLICTKVGTSIYDLWFRYQVVGPLKA